MSELSSATEKKVSDVKKSDEEVEDEIILTDHSKEENDNVNTEKESTEDKKKSNSWTEAQTIAKKEIKPQTEEFNPKQAEEKVKLNYILNELKNMKVAKANAKRPMKAHRIEKDDINIRYEQNSAVYLALKEETDKMEKGYLMADNENHVKMVVEKKNNEEDKEENIPKTVIKWTVTDEKNQFESNVTINMYHTNQSVHIQGGRRSGKVTTCGLAADMFETWSMLVCRDKSERIRMFKDAILEMDLRKKPFQTAKKLQFKSILAPVHFVCDFCPYKSVKQTELRRHIFILHRNRTNPDVRKLTDAKKRLASPPKAAPPPKKEVNTKKKDKEETIEKVECLLCKFDSDTETEMDKHMKEHEGKPLFQTYHIKVPGEPKDIVQSITTDMVDQAFKELSYDAKKETAEQKQMNEILTEEVRVLKLKLTTYTETEKENIQLTKKNESLIEDVEVLKLKVTNLTANLNHERDTLKETKKEKGEVESNYQEAARTISEQQGQITIREEQMKVLGELLKLDERVSLEEVESATTNEDTGWTEVYEEGTEDGDLLPHKEKNSVDLGCRKCDKILKSDHELREHMRRHIQLEKEILKCNECGHTTKDENELINHVIENHSPKHTCETCQSKFSTKTLVMEHIFQYHGFTFTANNKPELAMQCHDCSERFSIKPELMQHKREEHHKTRLCPFFHGTGWGCRLQSNFCFNIHEENITPTAEMVDFRKRIDCKHGANCDFNQRGICFYKHIVPNVRTNQTNQVTSRNIQTQPTQSYDLLQTYRCMDCVSEFVSKNDFDHHTRTAHRGVGVESSTYAAIVKIGEQLASVSQRLQFFELQSMKDFPTVGGVQKKM